jgi:hypothetical protein
MTRNPVVGIFDSVETAEQAGEALVHGGVPRRRIVISICLTEDGIAAEAPGQSYENQPGEPPEESAGARFGEAVRSGTCTLSIEADSNNDRARLTHLLRRSGARGIIDPPAPPHRY